MWLVFTIDLVVVLTLCIIAMKKGIAAALPYFTFFVVLLPDESQFKIPGLFDLTTRRVAVATLLILYLFTAFKGKRFPTPLKHVMLLAMGWAALSTVTSLQISTSIKQLISQVFEYYLVYFIFVRSIARLETVRKIALAFVMAIAVACVFGVCESYLHWSVVTLFPQFLAYEGNGMSGGALYEELLDRGLRIRSTFPHPILFGDSIVMALPLAIYCLTTFKGSGKKIAMWSIIGLMLWSVYKTSSRGPWIAAAFSLTLIFLLADRRAKRNVLILAGIGFLALVVRPGVWETIANTYRATMDSSSHMGSSFDYRSALWQAVTKAVNSSPQRFVLGHGLGTFRELGLIVDFHDSQGPTSYRWYTCDNSWALFVYEIGYGGLSVMMLLLFTPLWIAFRSYRRLPVGARYLSCTLFVSMLSFYWLMLSVAAYAWGQPGFILWILIALTVSYSRISQKRKQPLHRQNQLGPGMVRALPDFKARTLPILTVVVIVGCLLPANSQAADVLYIHRNASSSVSAEQAQLAARFHGLGYLDFDSRNDKTKITQALAANSLVAVIIAADALGEVDRTKIRRAIPLLILASDAKTSLPALTAWSDGAITGIQCSKPGENGGSYAFAQSALAYQLQGTQIYFRKPVCSFQLKEGKQAEVIASVESRLTKAPVLFSMQHGSQQLYFATQPPVTGSPGLASAFLANAPALLFLKEAAGDRAWHAGHLYANLTIDDPWLRERYGHIDYRELLEQMRSHNFHSTIAFIPWNYNRSEPATASLFRENPDRLSIAIHGNNHDHKEFTDYREKSFNEQVAAIDQSLDRMGKFQSLTGIPYDRVMIFPHSIAPEATLAFLKEDNFLATINGSNVPAGSTQPSDPGFSLRPATTAFSDFPSINRYSVEVPVEEDLIAINAFLGNPLLFYCHQGYFESGSTAFNKLADRINHIDGDLRWKGLGEIVRHLYLMKTSDDGTVDVLAIASDLQLDNTSPSEKSYRIDKQESGTPAIQSVRVNGVTVPYVFHKGHLQLAIAIPAGGSRHVQIEYAGHPRPNTSASVFAVVRIAALRWASDFRDIQLANLPSESILLHRYNAFGTVRAFASLLLVAITMTSLVLLRKFSFRSK